MKMVYLKTNGKKDPQKISAISYILNKKGMLQQELTVLGKSKQAVSKWVAGDRKIRKDVVEEWSKILKVPAELFCDERRYCRFGTEEELSDLEDYLLMKSVDFGDENLPGMDKAKEQVDLILYDKEIHRRFNRVRRKLHDVVFEHGGEVNTIEEHLHSCEMNLLWFEEMLDIRNKDLLNRREWSGITDAFSCLDLKESEVDMYGEEELTCKLYGWLKQRREREWISIVRAVKMLEHKMPDRELLGDDELACELYDYLSACRQEEADKQRELDELCTELYGNDIIINE